MHPDLLENKYTTWYLELIEYRRYRKISETTYIEKHHILPKSIGGNDSNENLILLTAREHFVAHLLLSKMFSGTSKIKMVVALRAMKNLNVTGKRHVCNSREFELVKTINSRLFKKLGKECADERALQEHLLNEGINLEQLKEKGLCKTCGINPRGVNYIKNGKKFYRSTCDKCARKKKTSPTPKWMIVGYRKKIKCDCCGFIADFREQLSVIDYKNTFKTICLNCKMASKLGKVLTFLKGDLVPDL